VAEPERRGVRFTKAGYAVVAALILLAGNAVQLTWTLDPSRRPDPNERLRAAIEPLAAEPSVSLGTYMLRTTAPGSVQRAIDEQARVKAGGDLSRQELLCARERLMAFRGHMVYANITVEGLKHRSVDLYATLYSAATRRRLATYEKEGLEVPLPAQRLTSPTDTFVQTAFLEAPPRPNGRYYAHFELRAHEDDGKIGTLLAVADGKPFAGVADKLPESYPHCAD
jgi:hypothetical protein